MKRLPILLVLLAGACGEVVKLQPDGGDDPDAGIDTPGSDADAAEGGMVHVHVLTLDGRGTPDLTAIVVMQDSTGAMTADGVVDGNGDFDGAVAAGASNITIIRKTLVGTEVRGTLSTVTDVTPGETIEFGTQLDLGNNRSGAAQSMSLAFGSQAPITVYTQCGQQGASVSPLTLDLYSTCHESTFDLFATAREPLAGAPRFAFLQDIVFAPGGSISLPAINRTYSTFQYLLQNVPTGIDTINASRASVIGNVPVDTQDGAELQQPAGGSISISVPYAAVVGLKGEYDVRFTRLGSNTVQSFVGRSAMSVDSETIDLSQQRLPWLTSSSLMLTQSGFTWSVSTGGGNGDAMAPVWAGSWQPTGGPKYTIAWRITTPYQQGFTLPRLPTKYAEFDPQAQTAVSVVAGNLTVIDYDRVTDFKMFRAHHDQLLTEPSDAALLFGATAFSARIAVTPYRTGLR